MVAPTGQVVQVTKPVPDKSMTEQLSEDADIAAAQILSMGAAQYAGAMITAHGGPRPGSSILEALSCARQELGVTTTLPAAVRSTLRDLQMVAVLFTVQLTASNDDPALESLWRLEDKLVAVLEQGTARISGHVSAAAMDLSARALDYMCQIITAEDNEEPIGSSAVAQAVTELHLAAIVFTMQLATAESCDPASLWRIEDELATRTRHGPC